jgi:hypothetical protein
MKRIAIVFMLFAVLFGSTGCGVIESVTGGGTPATELWTDVPKLEDAIKTDVAMPAPLRLLMNQVSGGKFDFVGYKTQSSADQIKAFYSKERMAGLGWNGDGGCNSLSAQTSGGNTPGAGFCTFTRTENGKISTLFIVLAQSDGTKDTTLFYVRAILPPTPVP